MCICYPPPRSPENWPGITRSKKATGRAAHSYDGSAGPTTSASGFEFASLRPTEHRARMAVLITSRVCFVPMTFSSHNRAVFTDGENFHLKESTSHRSSSSEFIHCDVHRPRVMSEATRPRRKRKSAFRDEQWSNKSIRRS